MRDKRNDVNKPKLEIGNRDYLATLKYALASNLHFKKGKMKVHRKELPQTYGYNRKKREPSLKEF